MLRYDTRKTGGGHRLWKGLFNANFASESDFMLGFDRLG
ncbi:MAG: hypothetical protein RLZZ130_1730 [Pseudomonadota bacterium]|jgi:hypothetical protein